MASHCLKIPGSDEEPTLNKAANKVLTKMSDLNDAGVTRDDIYKQFTKEFGVGPQDVHINEGICREYGRYCYNVQGDVSFANKSSQPCTMVSAEQTVTNTDSIPLTQTCTLEAQFTKSAKVTVMHSSSSNFIQSRHFYQFKCPRNWS